jgi:hypothetical protein
MAWRPMDSLLMLRTQVNILAPERSKASDGTVGDPEHQGTTSDHNPHFVAGVGSEMVTALDLTHDPAHNFDSYRFAEILRINQDRRIKYVISNRRIFSSYAVGSTPPWGWRTYKGTDPHTGHVHVSVLDAKISDTSTPWNLEGFVDDMSPSQQYIQHVINYRLEALIAGKPAYSVPAFVASDGSTFPALSGSNMVAQDLNDIQQRVTGLEASMVELKALLQQQTPPAAGGSFTLTLPVTGTLTGTGTVE